MSEKTITPSSEELDQLRRDASEGDPNAATFFRSSGDQKAQDNALAEWRRKQVPSSDK